jgi:hypothetical protein
MRIRLAILLCVFQSFAITVADTGGTANAGSCANCATTGQTAIVGIPGFTKVGESGNVPYSEPNRIVFLSKKKLSVSSSYVSWSKAQRTAVRAALVSIKGKLGDRWVLQPFKMSGGSDCLWLNQRTVADWKKTYGEDEMIEQIDESTHYSNCSTTAVLRDPSSDGIVKLIDKAPALSLSFTFGTRTTKGDQLDRDWPDGRLIVLATTDWYYCEGDC